MITQIEIDGFKTFKDFKVELAPFQVIVGPNGSGKSNLFDALQLLSRLADHDVYEAFQCIRGDASDLFTRYPDGSISNTIRIAVEMLVDRKGRDAFGKEVTLEYPRLRYELEIAQGTDENGLDELYIKQEALKTIPPEDDSWCKKYNADAYMNSSQEIEVFLNFIEGKTFTISYMTGEYFLEELDQGIQKIGPVEISEFHVNFEDKRTNTLLRETPVAMSNHVIAVLSELRSLKFLHINPTALRQHSSTKGPRFLSSDGGNLPATLARIKSEDPFAFRCISHDLSGLMPGSLQIDVEKNQQGREYEIRAEISDQRSFSAQVLSDGILRLLALATLRHDPQSRGTICIEEPENGVQPLYLNKFASLLREMATDFTDPDCADEPLRQVLVTTHSPIFISQPQVIDHLLLAVTPLSGDPKIKLPFLVTRMHAVLTPNTLTQAGLDPERDRAPKYYTIDIVKKYLDSGVLEEARQQLQQARADLQNLYKK
jgi:predicted ATPase